jgi:hypothetical protein
MKLSSPFHPDVKKAGTKDTMNAKKEERAALNFEVFIFIPS